MEGIEEKLQTTDEQNHEGLSVFVQNADSYIGRHVVTALTNNHYSVFGDKVPTKHFSSQIFTEIPEFEVVQSIDDAFALCNTFIFDIRKDPTTAISAFSKFEMATTPIKIILISTLMTWALTPTTTQLTGDDFRKRQPHPNYKAQYDAEIKATKLCRENNKIKVYVLSCGIPYGDGDELLFPFLKYAWSKKFNEYAGQKDYLSGLPLLGDGDNIVPMIHVRDLASLLVVTLQDKMIDRYVMAVDTGNCKLRDIVECVSKAFSDGSIMQISPDQALTIPWITQETIDYLTININAINELLGRVHMTNSEGFVAGITNGTLKNEFLQARGVESLRILISGPPLSGKSTLASRISYSYSLPLITVDSLVSEAKKNVNGYWSQFAQQVAGEISPSVLLDLLKWKLQDIPCKNQGFILDGIPSNLDFADALWTDTNLAQSYPQIFFELEASDNFLKKRAKEDPSMKLGIGNADEFESRLTQYRQTNGNDDNHLFYAFDPQKVRGMTIMIEKTPTVASLVKKAASFIGRPHNFGKPASLILRDSEALERQKRLHQEKLDKLEAEMREKEEAKKREKEQSIRILQAKVEKEETMLLSKYSKPQRDWLVEHVAPTLAEGLCFLIDEMPEDPIQLLGCFIAMKLPPEQQAELMNEFQPEEEDDIEEEEEEEDMNESN